MFNTKTLEAVGEAKSKIHNEEGSPVMNPHTLDEWLQRISNSVDEAQRQSCWGAESKAINELVHALALGMMALENHMTVDRRPEPDENHSNYIKEAVNGNGQQSDTNNKVDHLGTEDMRLIALYEMYASLESNFMQPFTEKFTQSLNERQGELMDKYLASKIAVLGGNQTLSIKPKKKAGAEAQGASTGLNRQQAPIREPSIKNTHYYEYFESHSTVELSHDAALWAE